ncbi:hypothetical protein Tco_1503178 [Tanacetum coccineum]
MISMLSLLLPELSEIMAGTRENIPKTSAMPHESSPRVTSLGGDELIDFCTKLQSQYSQMAAKIQSQVLEISQLKTRIKTLEDAPNTTRVRREMVNVLSSMGAANILTSGSHEEVMLGWLRTTESEGNKDVKEKDSDDHDKIINLQQWVVLVRQESLVDITPSVVKAPIYDWKIFKDKLREVYQIFRVGQAPKAYPYFEAMLKEFDRDDMVTLWKLVKDSFRRKNYQRLDLEKCQFWPLKRSCLNLLQLKDYSFPLLVIRSDTGVQVYPLLSRLFPLMLIEDKDYSESKMRIVMFRMYLWNIP